MYRLIPILTHLSSHWTVPLIKKSIQHAVEIAQLFSSFKDGVDNVQEYLKFVGNFTKETKLYKHTTIIC
jgi:hypothetical protein